MRTNGERRVKAPVHASPIERAAKLKAEAANCIALALDLAPDPFCIDLLDEAARLGARAARLGGAGEADAGG
jgi:predicted nucleic acid-binding protein